MDKLAKLLLNKIYSKSLPTTAGGGIQVPIVCPNYLRELFDYPGSPAPLLGAVVRELDFPFQAIHQRGVVSSQLRYPEGMHWHNFVGHHYGPTSVSGYVFLPKEFKITQELMKWAHRIGYWPKDVLVQYENVYNKPEEVTDGH